VLYANFVGDMLNDLCGFFFMCCVCLSIAIKALSRRLNN
jgi:hypothetical protein